MGQKRKKTPDERRANFLRARTWRPAPDGWHHPELYYGWPVKAAARLEHDRDAGDAEATWLLGAPQVSEMPVVPDEMPDDLPE